MAWQQVHPFGPALDVNSVRRRCSQFKRALPGSQRARGSSRPSPSLSLRDRERQMWESGRIPSSASGHARLITAVPLHKALQGSAAPLSHFLLGPCMAIFHHRHLLVVILHLLHHHHHSLSVLGALCSLYFPIRQSLLAGSAGGYTHGLSLDSNISRFTVALSLTRIEWWIQCGKSPIQSLFHNDNHT